MASQTVTPSHPIPMPRHTHLLRRGSRYYLNVKVPIDLRKPLGKTIIRKSLETSDPREANRLVRYESLKWQAYFDEQRHLKGASKSKPEAKRQVPVISDAEAHSLVFRWFISVEKMADHWWENDGIRFAPAQRAETLDTLRIDETVLNGGSQNFIPDDGSFDLDVFLTSEGIECPKDSPAYAKLRPLFRMARLENIRRTIDRVGYKPVVVHDSLFRETFAHSRPVQQRSSVALGELLSRFAKAQANRTAGTRMTYEIPARILREVLGENTPIDTITREDIERLCELLRQFPKNAAQRYPGLTLQQAIGVADKKATHSG